MQLVPVDAADVTIVVDNFIDILLTSDEHARRAPVTEDWLGRPQLRAEHGYSVVLTLERQGARRSIVYDAGLTPDAFGRNLDILGISLDDVECLALSHGHGDHHGGLEGVVRRLGHRNLPLILHPDAWRERRIVFPTGAIMNMPPPDRKLLERHEVEVRDRPDPTSVLADQAVLTGRIPRVTDFETGFPLQQARSGGAWEPDPWIWDDQSLICHVKGKGLVVISSCSHSGAINVLRNAQDLTGIPKIHAFVGGLHLTGGLFEPIISRTVQELRAIAPDFVVPGHCTGWKAVHEIERALPTAYIQTSVGTRLHFS